MRLNFHKSSKNPNLFNKISKLANDPRKFTNQTLYGLA